jgi:hypothetical protein
VVTPWECEQLTWIDPDGTAYVLTRQDDRDTVEGIRGRGMPPIRAVTELVPGQPGSRTRSLLHDARTVPVPVVFHDESQEQVRAILRGRMRLFDPTRGNGTLRVLTPDGYERDLTCHYIGGMEVVEAPPDRGISADEAHQAGVLVLYADDPYWYDVDPLEEQFTIDNATGQFFPIPNPTTGSFVTLVGSTVFTTVTITLTADVESWPVWTITGPGSDLALRNLTTGATLDFSANGGLDLIAAEVLTIDTRPYRKSALLADGTNVMPYLTDAGSDLWALQPGDNVVQVELTGATEDSLVELSVNQAFLTV